MAAPPATPSANGDSGSSGEDARDVLEGSVERVTFSNDDTGFRVIRVRPTVAEPARAVGAIPRISRLQRPDDALVTVVGRFLAVAPGEHVRAIGRLENDGRHGAQLRAEVVTAVTPTTIAGLERYLGSGIVKGIGKGTARKLVEAFGADTMRVLDSEPERLSTLKGFPRKKAELLIKTWRAHRVVRELMVTLASFGVSQSVATRIHKRYGDSAVQVVLRSPYRLAIELWGVGFRTADAIAAHVGIARDDPQRAQAGVLHTLQAIADEGHTVTPRALLRERTARLLEPHDAADGTSPARSDELPDAALIDRANEAIEALLRARLVVVEPEGLSHAPLAAHERGIADALMRLLVDDATSARLAGAGEACAAFESAKHVTLAGAQRRAIEEAARHRVVVVTGGPGVGKTTVVRALVALFEAAKLRVALAAPTGRAAKRMTESTGRAASTIHRLLEYDARTQAFQRTAVDPLAHDALIVDESSMLDAALAHALISAVPGHARLVMVGDVDQLPSVGPGAVLRDLIESEVVPTVRLTEVFRQREGARIVAAAHAILRGDEPEPSPSFRAGGAVRAPHGELFLLERGEPEEAASTIVDLVAAHIPRAFGLEPRTQIQVLIPMVKGVVGTRALNVALQARLNPSGPAVKRGETIYRVGDRVIQLRNDYDREVFNGDVGHVHALAHAGEATGGDDVPRAGGLRVRFEDGREVDYDAASLDALSLAYACTVHKAQGSEYPAVVIGLVNAHYMMLARKVLYTAVTRGRLLVVLVGSRWAIGQAVKDARGEERRTTLGRRLREW